MSDTTPETGADGIRENAGAPSGDEVRDEVRVNIDEERLENWDEVRGDYAVDPDAEVARPALTESEDDDENDAIVAGEDDEEDTEAEPDDDDADGGMDSDEEE